MDENAVLTKLIDSFDDFKERLIRIEENVKSIKDVKEEVDALKTKLTQEQESAKAAHKRIDSLEDREKDRANDIKWLKRQWTIGFIGFIFTVLAGVMLIFINYK